MGFMLLIIQWLNNIAWFFYDIYLETQGWIWPFHIVSSIFYELYNAFTQLYFRFMDFHNWVIYVSDMIEDIGVWEIIKALIKEWLPNLEAAIAWWGNWWNNIWNTVAAWWNTIIPTVQGWISIAVEGLSPLLEAWDTFWNVTWPEWVGNLSELRSLWDNFWTVIFPTLVSFTWLTSWWNDRLTDIQALINTAIKELAPFWEGWQEIKDTVLDFFSDPLEWLLDKFTDWFLGPEE